MEKKRVDLLSIEGKIYAKLDAGFMRKELSYKEKFDLGDGQRFNIGVSSKTGSPVSLRQDFSSKDIDITMNFGSGCGNHFRADNQANHNFLHLHFESGAQSFEDRIPVQEITSVSQIISDVFNKAEDIISWKFPDFFISGTGYVGTA